MSLSGTSSTIEDSMSGDPGLTLVILGMASNSNDDSVAGGSGLLCWVVFLMAPTGVVRFILVASVVVTFGRVEGILVVELVLAVAVVEVVVVAFEFIPGFGDSVVVAFFIGLSSIILSVTTFTTDETPTPMTLVALISGVVDGVSGVLPGVETVAVRFGPV